MKLYERGDIVAGIEPLAQALKRGEDSELFIKIWPL
jgi:hypothetical protein